MIARILALFILLSSPVSAQGFAGLGTDAEGFALPDPDHLFAFPGDHGPHPAFRIEWWYLTATLEGPDREPYGIQWTLFRSALAPEERPGWDSPQIWMGHMGITTRTDHFSAERLSRGGVGTAGVVADPFEAWIDTWDMTSRAAPGQDSLSKLDLRADGGTFGYDLTLEADGPLVFHGADGYSVKSPTGQASHYYSQPHYTITGTLHLPSGSVPVTGQGWLDREWSSKPLASNQTGWDWFSLVFEDRSKLMAFRLRDDKDGFQSGTWISPDGSTLALSDAEIRLTPLSETSVAGRSVPVTWRVEIPSRGVDVTVAALNPHAWMDVSVPYWEGPVTITGSHSGRGYLEMTGYSPDP